MTPKQLKTRIKSREDIQTEFKEMLPSADNLAKAMVAFANTNGGTIYIGVDDQGNLKGIAKGNVDSTRQFADNVAFNNCIPPLTISQETVTVSRDQAVVCVHVPKGEQRPYATRRGFYYIRTDSSSRRASHQELLRLFQAATSLYYDETPVQHATRADLNDKAINRLRDDIQAQGFDTAGLSAERLLQNWSLLHDDKPTVAGVLLCGESPQKHVPGGYISALRIPGNDIANEPNDQKQITGRLPDMLHDALRFIDLHLPRPHRINGLEPEFKPELPVEVLRELLVNALVHRDYTITAPIRLLIFDTSIDIHTPGTLPNSVTLEALKLGVHVLRNPVIYNIFLKIGLVTDAGSGIPRSIRKMRDATGKTPEFSLQGNEFVVSIPRQKS